MNNNSFNLIDEKWIITVDCGLVSLRQIFTDKSIKRLGGTVIEKLSVFKLLLAIAQAAYTPENDDEWYKYTSETMSSVICDYLDRYHDRFYLFSENPFLQFTEIKNLGKKILKPYSTIQPYVASGNNTIRTQSEVSFHLENSEIARLLVAQMNFAFGGKQVDNSIVLTDGYKKSKSGKVGIGLSYLGYLFSYFLGKNLIDTVRLNLLTKENVKETNMFPSGIGVAPWEKLPKGEDDEIARTYKGSLLSRLVSLGRFTLMEKDGLYLTEGLLYQDHKDGVGDPAITMDKSKKDIKVIWADPEKKPWRSFPSILSFITLTDKNTICYQLYLCRKRFISYKGLSGIWSCGQKVSSNSGEFRVSGRDEGVDSVVFFDSADILSDSWYDMYSREISSLEKLAYALQKSIEGYLDDLNKSKESAKQSMRGFWECIEPFSDDIAKYCADSDQIRRKNLRRLFSQIAVQCYDGACSCETANQFCAWSEHRLSTYKYEHEGE